MKITIINGSPRGEKGNTHIMVSEFERGARRGGAEVDLIFLAGKKISECRGCFTCWTKTPERCVIRDEMDDLLPSLLTTDLLIFATPLYVDNVTGLMKTFMDRMIPALDPRFEKDPDGEYRHRKRHEHSPALGVISNCGYPEQSHFQVLRLLFRRIARNLHSEVTVEIYRGGGELLGARSILLRPFQARYKKLLRSAGRAVAEEGRIPEDLQEKLDKPLIPDDRYAEAANAHWEREIR